MAGDWIPWDKTLPTKPEIGRLARALSTRKEPVLVACMRAWSWADDHGTALEPDDIHVPGAAPEDVDAATGLLGFGRAMITVGWLRADEAGLIFPHMGRWLTHTAKARLMDRDRKRRARAHQTAETAPTEPAQVAKVAT
jgi:hypothetical protein